MAVAVQPSSETKKPSQAMGLYAASIAGAAYVLIAAAIVLRIIPELWERAIGPALTSATNSFVSTALLIAIQVGAAVGLLYGGSRLGAGKQATGLRGGIFFMIVAAFLVFFAARFFLIHASRGFNFGSVVAMLFNAVIVFLVVQFFRTGRFTEWSVALDQGGWFEARSYKRTQGLRVRRLTILGLLLLAGSGIWTLMNHNYLPQNAELKRPDGTEFSNRMGDWVVGGTVLQPERGLPAEENRMRPRVEGGLTLLPDLQFTIPLLLIAASLWFAWRAVNYPTFGDFLIATEAEINKVSWTSRRALFRDTIVVLTSLVLLTLFLFVVDVFWSWLLSRDLIHVLPTHEDRAAQMSKDKSPEPVKDW
ncbi:MAG: preprotein translocase subunit SecE [Zavarzinella sp.]|nr:preprotein translocase subunit SecE [Zavarzinella sp.]